VYHIHGVRLLWLLITVPLWAQDCAPAIPLAPNDAQTAQLNQDSCQLSDGTAYQDYAVLFPVRGTVQLAAKGASIILRNSGGKRVNSGASLSQYVEGGLYRVLVNSGAPGKFPLTSVFVPEANVLCTKPRNIGAWQAASAQFTTASCKLPDGSNFDSWQVTIYGAGTLTVAMNSPDFATNVILRGSDGATLGADSNSGGGTNSLLSVEVPGNGAYTIVAAAANATQKAGHYQLVTSFTADAGETCIPSGALAPGALVAGNVSGDSCNFDLPGREDSSLFNFYNIHVDAAGVSQIQVTGSTFSPLLLLLDANGNEVTEDAQSAGAGAPVIEQQLAAGDYLLLIFNEDSFDGEYTLQYNFNAGPAFPCPVQSLAANSPGTGSLASTASCRVSGSMSDLYQVVLPSAGTLDMNMSSGDFTTFLILRDAKDSVIDYGQQTTDGSSSHVLLNLPAGTYYAAASSADLPGNYMLGYQFTPQAATGCAPPQAMGMNTGFVATLGPGSCTGTDGQFVDYYQFTTPADGTVAAVLTSGAIPSLLTLTDSNNNELRTDAGSYTQADSIVVQFLKAGKYRVQVRSDEYNLTGQYRVDALFTASAAKAPYCTPGTLQIGVAKAASLNYTSCQYYDGTFADFYKVQVTNAAKPVTITAASAIFSAALTVMDGRGNIVVAQINATAPGGASFTGPLPAGTYYIVVKPTENPSSSGAYTVSVKQ
jgi:hypothetical protein